jgi:hypothetical protein
MLHLTPQLSDLPFAVGFAFSPIATAVVSEAVYDTSSSQPLLGRRMATALTKR